MGIANKIITIAKTGHLLTLDEIWSEAESLGQVSVDNGFSSNGYRVQIRFQSRGSTVWATGSHSDIHTALQRAIEEARRLAS